MSASAEISGLRVGSAAYQPPCEDFQIANYVARESIGFLWHPWAIEGAHLMHIGLTGMGPYEDRVGVRRALGHLSSIWGDDGK